MLIPSLGVAQTVAPTPASPAGVVAQGSNTPSTASYSYTTISVASTSFYYGLGTVYQVTTTDGVGIRVLRYHPDVSGAGFNTGKQPILLIPGMACNINIYLATQTARITQLYGTCPLPSQLASWAQGDANIQNNPMLYYSLAYYLWKEGYDVWLVNYRGCGIQEMQSGMPSNQGMGAIEDFALYDVDAAVNLVYQVTGGYHPILCGHSTGGTSAMMLLQGCTFASEYGHVTSTSAMAQQRNGLTAGAESIKGFIGLEPAGIPIVTSVLDNSYTWFIMTSWTSENVHAMAASLDSQNQLNLGNLIAAVGSDILSNVIGSILAAIWGIICSSIINNFENALQSYLNLCSSNTNNWLTYFLLLYAADRFYESMIGQYADWAWENTIREDYWNTQQQMSSPPTTCSKSDGYYYFIDTPWSTNMAQWTVPSEFIFGDNTNTVLRLVNSSEIIKDYADAKTPTSYDVIYNNLPAYHIDLPFGLCAPTTVFPDIGSFLPEVAAYW